MSKRIGPFVAQLVSKFRTTISREFPDLGIRLEVSAVADTQEGAQIKAFKRAGHFLLVVIHPDDLLPL